MCRPALSNYSPLAVETAVEAGLILLGQPFSCLIIYGWILFCEASCISYTFYHGVMFDFSAEKG